MADDVIAVFARLILTAGGKAVEVRAAWCEVGRIESQHYVVPVVARWRVRA